MEDALNALHFLHHVVVQEQLALSADVYDSGSLLGNALQAQVINEYPGRFVPVGAEGIRHGRQSHHYTAGTTGRDRFNMCLLPYSVLRDGGVCGLQRVEETIYELEIQVSRGARVLLEPAGQPPLLKRLHREPQAARGWCDLLACAASQLQSFAAAVRLIGREGHVASRLDPRHRFATLRVGHLETRIRHYASHAANVGSTPGRK